MNVSLSKYVFFIDPKFSMEHIREITDLFFNVKSSK